MTQAKNLNVDNGTLNQDAELRNSTEESNILNNLQSWANTGRKNASDILKSIISPLQQPNETSIAASIGMILLPLLTERSLNQGIKAIDQDLNLRLRRRDQNFNGKWVGLSQNGQALIIRREQGILTIEKTSKHLSNSSLTKLPGFDTNGRSLLSIATTHCQRPGKLIREILKARAELLQNTDPEISWEAWLQDNFAEKNRSVKLNNDAVKSLQQLKQLAKACSYEPALADVVMLNQIYDCLIMLGMDEHHAEKCEPQKQYRSMTEIDKKISA